MGENHVVLTTSRRGMGVHFGWPLKIPNLVNKCMEYRLLSGVCKCRVHVNYVCSTLQDKRADFGANVPFHKKVLSPFLLDLNWIYLLPL